MIDTVTCCFCRKKVGATLPLHSLGLRRASVHHWRRDRWLGRVPCEGRRLLSVEDWTPADGPLSDPRALK